MQCMTVDTFPRQCTKAVGSMADCLRALIAFLFFSREAKNPDFYVQVSDFLVLATD